MSHTDLRDFAAEAIYQVPECTRRLVIEIEKAGGGTLGKAYEGTWHAIVTYGDEEILRSQEFSAGTPLTHAEAAAWVAEWLASGDARTSRQAAVGAAARAALISFSMEMDPKSWSEAAADVDGRRTGAPWNRWEESREA